jgi:UDP-N-acetylglucosamine--N-acetylmuramyl-(pentapeptide) pyrophosphoryl-undecaprenol N-acetylglucosamine transferase
MMNDGGYNIMILFFTSPIGLGHASRDIAIAEKLKKLKSAHNEIIFVSGAGAFNLIFNNSYSAFNLYKPINFYIHSGELKKPFTWLIKYLSYYKRCKTAAEEILVKHDHLIVSDEDFASIAIGEKMNRKRILITDITETRFTNGIVSVLETRMNKIMQRMIDKCTHVIIPDYGDNNDNLVYVGPIVREVTADRNTLRKKFGFNKKTIILSSGSTEAGIHLVTRSLEAYRRLKTKMDIDLVLVGTPVEKLAYSSDFRNVGLVNNLHEYIYASDLVISLAGRSTMDESMVYGIPGIFIPIKNHFEQEDCAKRLGYKYEDIFKIERFIEEKLDSPSRGITQANGAEKAAKLILQSL